MNPQRDANHRRPADLAAAHGISAQTVRNYEQAGMIPPAGRTPNGYRVYTAVHAAALDAFVALIPGFGHTTAGEIMRAVNRGDRDSAFPLIDGAHAQLQADRATLDAVEPAIRDLVPPPDPDGPDRPVPIGAVAHRLGLTPATLRKWERAGILRPHRDRGTHHRVYRSTDLRDADLAHLLRRGGYPLAHIATVLDQTRRAGGAGALAASLADWRNRLSARARAMLTGAAHLDAYLRVLDA
ncbi:MerR family DNA-binding transcriptional regulator [Virgisporangium ochraceum]|uniref:MerR family transcriptional regulator n=1 Tax=Virgisporangium ochraceum TaxID=65505 RepID=A0A8J3ZU59_9ACTN|nr:MerR family DNA-binding transcriptional regulator [Virgisporangium ochraceum]GIJ68108.1 MerR family transcriptional regulator [Virgisporangium ochraceum]